MRHDLKQMGRTIVSSILAAALFLTCFAQIVIAEEAQPSDDTNRYGVFPGENHIGQSWNEILESEKALVYDSTFDFHANASAENKTLSDGTAFIEASILGVPSYQTTIDQYYYLINNKMTACIYKYQIPEQHTAEEATEYLTGVMGASLPLNLTSISTSQMEMISDQAELKEGLQSWQKDGITVVIYVNDEDPQVLNYVLIAPADKIKDPSEIKLSGLTGTEDLTAEEIEKVNTYIDFLQSQIMTQTNAFIAYLKTQRQDASPQLAE